MTPNPFHVPLGAKAIRHPHEYDGGEVLRLSWDLGAVSAAEKKKVLAAWIELLPTLTRVRQLHLWSHVSQPLFDAACGMRGLQLLRIKWSGIQSLDRIAGLASLEALSIGSSTKVQSIEPLASLPSLRVLELENFKRVSDFSVLARMQQLRSLAIVGSMWSRQAVDSLEPFAAMTGLESLAVDTFRVTSLRPLASLRNLKELGLGGRMPYQEYAWLAAKLPGTQCQWFAPYLDLSGKGYGPCKQCKGASMVMVTGRGKPTLCTRCDGEQLAKHVAMFEMARLAALAEA